MESSECDYSLNNKKGLKTQIQLMLIAEVPSNNFGPHHRKKYLSSGHHVG